jgi:hypothetical protein
MKQFSLSFSTFLSFENGKMTEHDIVIYQRTRRVLKLNNGHAIFQHKQSRKMLSAFFRNGESTIS